jgi:hypothetical protein
VTTISNITRPEGDPKILHTGPSSLSAVDRLGRALGWFSIGLGLLELLAPARVTRALGMEGSERLVRAYGVREIGGGILSLSVDKELGLWCRIAGDGLDLLTVATALHPDNQKRGNAERALATVAAITLLDVIAAKGVAGRHSRKPDSSRQYSDRSGFPRGLESARGAAREIKQLPAPEPAAEAAGKTRSDSRRVKARPPSRPARGNGTDRGMDRAGPASPY